MQGTGESRGTQGREQDERTTREKKHHLPAPLNERSQELWASKFSIQTVASRGMPRQKELSSSLAEHAT